jgi:hypothetical protein
MSGGKNKKVTTGYKFYAGAALAIAKYIKRITLIKIGDKVAWAGSLDGPGVISINKPTLWGTTVEGGVVGDFAFLPGLGDQMPDPYLASKLGANIPAGRGVSQLVARQAYWGNTPYIKDVTVRGERVDVLDDGSPQWYPEKAAIINSAYLITADQANWRYLVIAQSDTVNRSSPTFDDSSWNIGQAPFGDEYNEAAATYGFPGNPATILPQNMAAWLRTDIIIPNIDNDFLFEAFVDNGIDFYVNGVKVASTYINAGGYYSTTITKDKFVVGVNKIAVRGTDDLNTAGKFYFGFRLRPIQAEIYDMNPAHMLREILTNAEWGYGYSPLDIDDDSFRAAADLWYGEDFGLSYFWDDETVDLEDMKNSVLDHVDAAMYVDRSTLLWTITPVRDDYDPDNLLELTDGIEVSSIDNYDKPQFLELVNLVTVNYYNTAIGGNASIPAPNAALFLQQGVRVAKTKNYDMCRRSDLAARLASRDLNVESSPLSSCTVTANSTAKRLHRGSVFRLTSKAWNYDRTIMRVTGITTGDGTTRKVKIDCVEDRFGMPATSPVQPQPPAPPDPNGYPVPLTSRLVIEVPYAYLVDQEGQSQIDSALTTDPDIGYIGATAARTSGALNADMMLDAGAGYEDVAVVDFAPFGTLSADIDQLATSFTLASYEDLDEIAVQGMWMQIDDEIVGWTTRTDQTFSGLLRGILDTVPAPHAAGAKVFFIQTYLDGPETQYGAGEALAVRLLPNAPHGQLDIALAQTDTVTMASRAIRPYPPANFKINDEYYPASITDTDIVVSFAHRDRVAQQDQPVDSFTADVGPEAGTTYTLRGYVENVLDDTISGVTTSPITWTPATTGLTRVELESVRDGYTSTYKQVWEFDHGVPPPWTPANLFTLSQRGLWLDPNDLTTMFQDSAGTTPVTAVGDPVGLWQDKSGNGNHVSQATSGKRPILRNDGVSNYLEFTAASSMFLEATTTSAALALNAQSMMTISGASINSLTAGSALISRAVAGPGAGRYDVEFNSFNSGQLVAGFFGSPSDYAAQGVLSSTNPQVMSSKIDRVAGAMTAETYNGAATTPVPANTTNYNQSWRFLIGAYATPSGETLLFDGRCYGTMIQFDNTLDSTLYTKAKAWMAGVMKPAGAKKAWRVVILTNFGATTVEIRHIEFRSVAGTPEPATGGTAFASSTFGSLNLPDFAFGTDGAGSSDDNEAWASASGNNKGFIGYIFPADQAVVQVALKAPVTDPTTQMPQKFRIESSVDTTTGLDGTWRDETGVITDSVSWANGEVRVYAVAMP